MTSEQPWSKWTAADYSIEQWRRACVLTMPGGDPDSKSTYKLPIRTPAGAINRNGVHAAAAALAGARGGVNAPPEAKAKAKAAIRGAYKQIGEGKDMPDSLTASGARRFFKAGSRGDVPRDANGQWTRGNPGGGPRVSGATGQVENARGGPKEDGSPQAVGMENGTRVTTRPPKGDERFADGPDVDNAIRNTYTLEGEDWDPPMTAEEDIGTGMNLGNAYKAIGEKRGREGQDRLMHRWRTGQTLPPPRYGPDGNELPDPWRQGGSVNEPNLWDRKMGAGARLAVRRQFRRPADPARTRMPRRFKVPC